jgi:hypothetical protein
VCRFHSGKPKNNLHRHSTHNLGSLSSKVPPIPDLQLQVTKTTGHICRRKAAVVLLISHLGITGTDKTGASTETGVWASAWCVHTCDTHTHVQTHTFCVCGMCVCMYLYMCCVHMQRLACGCTHKWHMHMYMCLLYTCGVHIGVPMCTCMCDAFMHCNVVVWHMCGCAHMYVLHMHFHMCSCVYIWVVMCLWLAGCTQTWHIIYVYICTCDKYTLLQYKCKCAMYAWCIGTHVWLCTHENTCVHVLACV